MRGVRLPFDESVSVSARVCVCVCNSSEDGRKCCLGCSSMTLGQASVWAGKWAAGPRLGSSAFTQQISLIQAPQRAFHLYSQKLFRPKWTHLLRKGFVLLLVVVWLLLQWEFRYFFFWWWMFLCVCVCVKDKVPASGWIIHAHKLPQSLYVPVNGLCEWEMGLTAIGSILSCITSVCRRPLRC